MAEGRNSRGLTGLRLAGVVILILLLFVAGCVGLVYYKYKQEEAIDRSPIVIVDGTDVSGMTEEQAAETILAKYPWDMKVVFDGGDYPIEDVFSPIVHEAVKRAKQEEQKILDAQAAVTFEEKIKNLFKEPEKRKQIEMELRGVDHTDMLAAQVAGDLADHLASPAEDSKLVGFEDDGFQVTESKTGTELDTVKLTSDIKQALQSGDYTAQIPVTLNKIEPTIAKDDYQTIGYFKTHTTASESRNTNVRLAAAAINGKIVEPGETFSFNETVGRRTAEKGYKEAPAYSNGETVQEYGGGVCQVSSTLYNAIVAAGFDASDRTGHTYEPSYVTPGQDATVSYMHPDFAFVNNTEHPIGIKAHYADRYVTVEIFGISQLGEGEKRYLSSEKTGSIEPGYAMVEDPTIPFMSEEVLSGGKPGSVWKTYIVIEKDGKEISKEYLHTTKYRPHDGTKRTNTTNPAVPPLPPAPPAPPAG